MIVQRATHLKYRETPTSFVSFECNGCKVDGLTGRWRGGGKLVTSGVPKSAGKKRAHYRARSASGSARQRTSARTWARVFTGNKRSGASKWSCQIVFPLDGPRLTVAASLLCFSPEQKESIARRSYGCTHAVMSSRARKCVRWQREKIMKK